MKKVLSFILVLTILISSVSFAEPTADTSINATSAILIDSATGRVLFAKDEKSKQYPASITKILTAIIVLENCTLNETTTVSEKAVMSVPAGASIGYFKKGEVVTVEQLLYALLIPSANDAANILAEHVAGSVDAFAAMMNAKATEIGALNSNFVNANGLHDPNHYTTAEDMALITRYALLNEKISPTFKKITTSTSYIMPPTAVYPENNRKYTNTNLMLFNEKVAPNTVNYYYEYITGVKTGYTKQAGNTYVASAKKDNMELICVLLKVTNSTEVSNRYLDAKKLFIYGFNNFTLKQITSPIPATEIENAKRGQKLELSIENNGPIVVNANTDVSKLTPRIQLKTGLTAPINKNSVVGTVTFEVEGVTQTYNLIAKNDVEKKSSIGQILWNILKVIVIVILSLLGFFIALAIAVRVVKKLVRKKKHSARRYKNSKE